jgi:hypothetical protein
MTRVLLCGVVAVLFQPLAQPQPMPMTRAVWVWETVPLLRDVDERRAFFDFCARHEISVAGVQVATHVTEAGRVLTDATQWRAVLAESRRRGVRLHALDGDPHYALRSQHDTGLAIVQAVAAYNASVGERERFAGIHFDIEPYLLPEWRDPGSRERLLAEYLDLNAKAAKLARAAALVYTVDIPFWWQSVDSTTGEPVSITTFQGERKSALDHLLAIVDNVGVMAYRNVADGPDGIISVALDTLDRADRIGKARAFIGVETEKVSDGVPAKVTFAGKTLAELWKELQAVDDVFVGRPAFAGVAVHRYVTMKELKQR